jgi:hypothetical protein
MLGSAITQAPEAREFRLQVLLFISKGWKLVQKYFSFLVLKGTYLKCVSLGPQLD